MEIIQHHSRDPDTFFFFYWVKSFFNRRIAWLSTFLFGTAHLLINFIKISYPNHLAFLLFIILLWFSQRIKTHSTYLNFGILGFVFGLAFYIFIGPLFPLMLLPVIVPLFIPRAKSPLRLVAQKNNGHCWSLWTDSTALFAGDGFFSLAGDVHTFQSRCFHTVSSSHLECFRKILSLYTAV